MTDRMFDFYILESNASNILVARITYTYITRFKSSRVNIHCCRNGGDGDAVYSFVSLFFFDGGSPQKEIIVIEDCSQSVDVSLALGFGFSSDGSIILVSYLCRFLEPVQMPISSGFFLITSLMSGPELTFKTGKVMWSRKCVQNVKLLLQVWPCVSSPGKSP